MPAPLPAELAKVVPADAWQAWAPSPEEPWDRRAVSHLYRRAAFGPSPADTARALADGFPRTLDRLLSGEPDAAERLAMCEDAGRYLLDGGTIRLRPDFSNNRDDPAVPVRAWWLYTILEGGHPLREKLALFWHNHFATSYAKVASIRLMFEQNRTLRRFALGRFRPFLLAMSRDPAMLIWLDSNQNVKGAPNENYAREVMELFSLGVGNYSEKDVQEAARAFTGWHHAPDQSAFDFNRDLHDDGPKTIFGRAGNWGGDDVLRLCGDHPACARFLVGKLYAFFVSETPPPRALLAPLEDRFRRSDYDIAELVRTILGSRLFFSAHAYRRRVKWPVEYALGAVRAVAPDRVPLGDLIDPLAKMGQVLFAPPNVKGWRTGTDWLNSATLLARNNFAETVAMGAWPRRSARQTPEGPEAIAVKDEPAGEILAIELTAQTVVAAVGGPAVYGASVATNPDGRDSLIVVGPLMPAGGAVGSPRPGAPTAPMDPRLDPTLTLFEPKPTSVAEVVARMGDALYGEPASPAARRKIETYLLDGKPSLSAEQLDTPAFKARTREALHALMCLPEYQLN
jgi:hypothetical protein